MCIYTHMCIYIKFSHVKEIAGKDYFSRTLIFLLQALS